MKVTDARYQRAQQVELEWWTNNTWSPHVSWNRYDQVFLPYYGEQFYGLAIDVGSGPVPVLCNHNVFFRTGIAVDPLIFEYEKILKYQLYFTKMFNRKKSLSSLDSDSADTMFCLNTLDHCADPSLFGPCGFQGQARPAGRAGCGDRVSARRRRLAVCQPRVLYRPGRALRGTVALGHVVFL